MYAIIRTGDKQFRVEPGKTIRIPSLEAEVGEEITFSDVLLASADGDVKVGTPTVEGAVVTGEVVAHGKGEKIVVFKWKRRKNYRRKQGHRQKYTEVRIGEIRVG
ncbi:MAG TPA: 50S ribosomal protein L21 [Longimicrobiales bacterium]